MNSNTRVFSFAAIFVCWMVLVGGSSIAQQKQAPGVTIESRRSADLPASEGNQNRPTTIDVDQIIEFDRIYGTCIGDEGALVEGASVQLYRTSNKHGGRKDVIELVDSTVTGSNGKFDFENLQSRFNTEKFDKYFVMVVRMPGYATKFLSSIFWKPGEQEIQLSNRAMVKGFIKNDLGQPVPDAKVSFYSPLKTALPDVYATTTDEKGAFEIDDYHTINSVAYKTRDGKTKGTSAVPLIVEHPDYGRVSLMIERTPNLFFVTITRGAIFTGRTVNERGQPVADCRISMQSHNREPHIWFETTSGKDGKFQLRKLPGIRANMFFKTDDLIGESVEVNGEQGSETNLGDLKLVRPVLVQGIVIDDETNQSLKIKEGLRYSIGWHGPERPKTSAGISSAVIKADGTFECRFLPGKNFPYVASGYLKMVNRPYKDGIEITPDFDQTLEFRVMHRPLDK